MSSQMSVSQISQASALAWTKANAPENVVSLDEADKLEINAALQAWKNNKLGDASKVSKETFPLPTLGPRLEEIARNLHFGSGFAVLRSIDTKAYGPEDNLLVYLGVSSYIGSQRGAQNKKRDMVTHITDAKEWSTVPHEKRHGIHTTSALPFHNDMGCEILALQYREVAKRGGATSLASATTVLAHLAARHPEHLQALLAPDWPVQLSGAPAPRFARLPLAAVVAAAAISDDDDDDGRRRRVVLSVDPGRLGLHPATAGLGREDGAACDLSGAQLGALAALASLAAEHAVSVAARPGDVLFINNLALLHKREAYDDDDDGEEGEEGGARRHLVRLWLRNPEMAWDVPEEMKAPWYSAYGSGSPKEEEEEEEEEEDFGRFLKMTEDRYQVVPEKEYKVPRYSSGSAAWLIDVDEA